jgi:F-type H+-transporting ATPase subunit alpha
LERGRRVREVFKQPQYEPLPVAEQIAVLFAAGEGILDAVPLEQIAEAERVIRQAVTRQPELCRRMEAGAKVTPADREELLRLARGAVEDVVTGEDDANA